MIPHRSLMHVILLVIALVNMLPAIETEDSWGLMSIALAAAVVSLLYSGGKRPSPVRPWMVTIGVLIAVGYAVYEMFIQRDEAPVYVLDLGHFIVLLCCCKFFELRSGRDAGIILLMSFLLLIIGAFVSASLVFAAVVLADLTIGVAWLLEFQSRRDAERVALAAEQFGVARGPSLKEGLPAAPVFRSRVMACVGCSMGLAVAGFAIFVAIPRGWSTGLFGQMHRMVPTAVSGYSDEITLRDAAIFEDPTPVMRVRFTQGGKTLGGDHFRPLMRGGTLDRYVRGRWERTHNYAQARRHAHRGMSVESLFNTSPRYATEELLEQEVILIRPTRGNLFSQYPPVYFGSNDLTYLQQDPIDLCLHTPQIPKRDTGYIVYSWRPRSPAFDRRIEFAPRATYRRDERSIISSRVSDFAWELCRTFGNPADPNEREAICRQLEHHLGGDRYTYTLSRGRPPHGVDPVEDFLLTSRKGHCEYFASAMVVLCQAVNIPARLVSGYAGGEFIPETGIYQFRQKDAHAWVEVFLTDKGWTAFDPTPADDQRENSQQAGFWAVAARWVDLLRAQWSSSVVLFDSDRRGGLIAQFRDWFRSMGAGEQSGAFTGSTLTALLWGPEMILPWERVMYWFLLLLILAFLILLLRVVWLTALIVRAYLPHPSERDPRRTRRAEARFYDRLIALLENKGHTKPANQTPLEFARCISQAHRDLADLPTLVHWFYEVQYGQRPLNRDRVGRLNVFLQKLRDDPAFGTR